MFERGNKMTDKKKITVEDEIIIKDSFNIKSKTLIDEYNIEENNPIGNEDKVKKGKVKKTIILE